MDTAHLIQDHINEMSIIQNSIQEFVDEDADEELDDYYFERIMSNLKKFNILNDHIKIESFLRSISILSNNHHRYTTFYSKIQRLLLEIKDDILHQLTNFEIFSIFKKNKLLLLYLFDSKIIVPDDDISLTITFQKYQERNYPQFFWPEFKTFFSKELNAKIEQELNEIGIDDEETLKQKRKVGQNDQLICQLIREDSVEDFIKLINEKSIPLSMKIDSSIFETNPLLMKKKHSLIEYSIFVGSIQIINYLLMNEIQLQKSHWIYAVHGSNPEVISLLESNGIKQPKKKIDQEDNCEYNVILREAIKCHHNEIAYYFINSIQNPYEIKKTYLKTLKYYNYEYFHEDTLKYDLLSLMKLKNATLCELFMNSKYVNLNKGIKRKNSNKTKIEQTPLIKAIELNFNDLAQVLIQKKQLKINENINIKSNINEINALSYAIQQNNSEIVQLILKRKDINVNIESIYAQNE